MYGADLAALLKDTDASIKAYFAGSGCRLTALHYQVEVAPAGTDGKASIHLQGVACFSKGNQQRVKGAADIIAAASPLCSRPHVEVMKGTLQQALEYIQKEESSLLELLDSPVMAELKSLHPDVVEELRTLARGAHGDISKAVGGTVATGGKAGKRNDIIGLEQFVRDAYAAGVTRTRMRNHVIVNAPADVKAAAFRYLNALDVMITAHEPKVEFQLPEELYPWQRKLIELIEEKPDDRTSYYILDWAGGKGKSTVTKVLVSGWGGQVFEGRSEDFAEYVDADGALYITDIERANFDKYVTLAARLARSLKNKLIYKTKYLSAPIWLRHQPHVVLFANKPCPEELMSKDALVTYTIVRMAPGTLHAGEFHLVKGVVPEASAEAYGGDDVCVPVRPVDISLLRSPSKVVKAAGKGKKPAARLAAIERAADAARKDTAMKITPFVRVAGTVTPAAAATAAALERYTAPTPIQLEESDDDVVVEVASAAPASPAGAGSSAAVPPAPIKVAGTKRMRDMPDSDDEEAAIVAEQDALAGPRAEARKDELLDRLRGCTHLEVRPTTAALAERRKQHGQLNPLMPNGWEPILKTSALGILLLELHDDFPEVIDDLTAVAQQEMLELMAGSTIHGDEEDEGTDVLDDDAELANELAMDDHERYMQWAAKGGRELDIARGGGAGYGSGSFAGGAGAGAGAGGAGAGAGAGAGGAGYQRFKTKPF